MTPVFWNLSNHASTGNWSEQQKAAARAWGDPGPRTIRDVPFPAVDPEAGPAAIHRMAEDLSGRLIASGARPGDPILVMGEFSLAFELVGLLKAAGLVPLTATSAREATETLLPDGSVELRHCFRFVQFRPY